jgi:hypothetical protein
MKRTDRGKLDTGKELENRARSAAAIREGKAESEASGPGGERWQRRTQPRIPEWIEGQSFLESRTLRIDNPSESSRCPSSRR